jgi:hypothetical protein
MEILRNITANPGTIAIPVPRIKSGVSKIRCWRANKPLKMAVIFVIRFNSNVTQDNTCCNYGQMGARGGAVG